MLQLIVEIIISVGIIALLAMALMHRNKEKKVYVIDENDEERGKYWDAHEQGWSSKKERGRIQERRDTYLETTADMLKKQLITFVYDENPDLANLDSKGFANLNNALSRHAQIIVQDVEKIKKDFVVK
jgi:FtsZ-interacting cell division protein ZipA